MKTNDEELRRFEHVNLEHDRFFQGPEPIHSVVADGPGKLRGIIGWVDEVLVSGYAGNNKIVFTAYINDAPCSPSISFEIANDAGNGYVGRHLIMDDTAPDLVLYDLITVKVTTGSEFADASMCHVTVITDTDPTAGQDQTP